MLRFNGGDADAAPEWEQLQTDVDSEKVNPLDVCQTLEGDPPLQGAGADAGPSDAKRPRTEQSEMGAKDKVVASALPRQITLA